jgi:hypothetical protein
MVLPGVFQGILVLQVRLLVSYGPPRPFYEDIVLHSTPAVHIDANPGRLQGKLRPEIRRQGLSHSFRPAVFYLLILPEPKLSIGYLTGFRKVSG